MSYASVFLFVQRGFSIKHFLWIEYWYSCIIFQTRQTYRQAKTFFKVHVSYYQPRFNSYLQDGFSRWPTNEFMFLGAQVKRGASNSLILLEDKDADQGKTSAFLSLRAMLFQTFLIFWIFLGIFWIPLKSFEFFWNLLDSFWFL